MAKKASGEQSIKIGKKSIRLRLDIGTVMDLEEHLGVSFMEWGLTDLASLKVSNFAILFLAMTGGDFTDKDEVRKAATQLFNNNYIACCTAIASVVREVVAAMAAQAEKVKDHPRSTTKKKKMPPTT